MKTLLALCALAALMLASSPAPAQNNSSGAAKSGVTEGFEELVAKAEVARKDDLADEAIRLYRETVRLRPGYVEGWWYLGTLNYEMDRYDDGTDAFAHVAGLKPDMALAWAMWGLCEFETKNYRSALVHLERADQVGIPNQESFREVARYHLALLLTRTGRFEDAMRVMAEFSLHGRQTPDFDEAMGLAAMRKPLLPIELAPSQREMVLDVGHSMNDMAARRQSDVRQDITRLLAKYPDTPHIHFLVGTLELTNDSDKALEQWKAELKVSPDHPQALVSIAAEYLRRADYKAAQPYAEKAVEVDPQSFEAHAILGQLLSEGNLDIPRAIHELEGAASLAPRNPKVRYALASAYAKAGRKQDAEKERAEFMKLRGQGAVTAPKSE